MLLTCAAVQVAFSKLGGHKRLCGWEAVRGKRSRVPGSVMAAGRDVPHDLAQYVVEAANGCRHGFWGLIAKGATFRSTGRKRTVPGRRVIAEHVDELDATEKLAGEIVQRWRDGGSVPELDAVLAQWRSLQEGERLVFDWPSPVGRIER